MTTNERLGRVYAIGPISPSILELDVSRELILPDDYDDGPFAVPDLRVDPALPSEDDDAPTLM